jgi:hypothetical protein
VAHTVRSLAIAIALAAAAVTAYEPAVDEVGVLNAIRLGQSRVEAERERFHQAYRTVVNRPPVDSVEVVTPFRRVVMAAESRARLGGGIFTQREGLAIISAGAGRLDVIVETTFHPLNTFVAVPAYDVRLGAPGGRAAIAPIATDRTPRYALGTERPGTGQPLLGGTVTASFDGAALNPSGLYDVVITDAGKELARTRIDLAKIR